mgnify:CR=1 FL=1
MIYFDNAATTLHKPDEVIEAVVHAMTTSGNASRGTLGKRDHVISTDLEHNSVLRPLYHLEEQGASLTFLSASNRKRGCGKTRLSFFTSPKSYA